MSTIDPVHAPWAGTFVAQSINDQPLPAMYSNTETLRFLVAADTIVVDGRGRYDDRIMIAVDPVATNHRELQREVSSGTIRINGDTVEFDFQCPPGASCVRPPRGEFTKDGGIVKSFRLAKWTGVDQFERVQ